MENPLKNYTLPRLFEEMVEGILHGVEVSANFKIVPPIPIEEIATDVFGYQIRFVDLRYLKKMVRGVLFPAEKRILIDSYYNNLRQRFAIAHELGHILLNHSSYNTTNFSYAEPGLLGIEWDKLIASCFPGSIETQASKFAGIVLIPRYLLIPRLIQFPKVDAEAVSPLADEFEVSSSTMLYRLLDLNDNDLLYTMTDGNYSTRLLVDTESLHEFKKRIKESSVTRVIKRPPLLNHDRSLTHDRNKRAIVKALETQEIPLQATILSISSAPELTRFIVGLGNRNQIAVMLGCIPDISIPTNIHVLETLKNDGKVVVIICTHQKNQCNCNLIKKLRQVDYIVYYHPESVSNSQDLPQAIQEYVVAKIQPDKWMEQRLQNILDQGETFEPQDDSLTWIESDSIQLPLWNPEPLKTIKDARKEIRSFQKSGKKVVLTIGCFDFLHIGHISFLESVKKENEVLIVGIEDDKRVWQYKGRLINNVRDRYKMLQSLRCVDFVFVISEVPKWRGKDFYKALCQYLKPDFRATHDIDTLIEQKQAQIEAANGTLRIVSDYEHGHSTTNDFAKLLRQYSSDPNQLTRWKLDKSSLEEWETAKPIVEYNKLISYWNNIEATQEAPEIHRQLRLF
ncbi:MAG: ImmA/IrrE family metallo-endopeptidase [Anaerolineae bacterium]|nr:ImmA/IrrE family metallo-endopeptidase [Anaerolineae bacterium]